MSSSWNNELRILLGFAILGFSAGALLENWHLALLISLAGYLLWHLLNLLRLRRHLKLRRRFQSRFPPGLWGEIHQRVSTLQKRGSTRRRRLSRFASRFRDAAAALPDAAVIIGQHQEVEWANPAALRMLGVTWPEMQGKSLLKIVSHPILEEYLQQADYSRPLEFTPPNNKSAVISLGITPFGKTQHYLIVARDITQLYNLNQTRRDFVSNVSHELRTPLTVINGFLETLVHSNKKLTEHGRALQLMHQQTERMEVIIADLLTLSRLEMDQKEQPQEAVAVPLLLESVIVEAKALSGERRHVLNLQSDPSLWMRGSESELRSAFSNLIFNAVRHTPSRSEITVRWEKSADDLCLSVRDTGEGIAAIHIPRLTERFYRVDTGRSRQSGGTGLGLAIVKHVLSRHGGELRIESQAGKGSTFSCYFPLELALHHNPAVMMGHPNAETQ